MIHDIVVKANLFLVGGFIYRLKGSYSIRQLGGLYQSHPKLSLLLLIPLFSLVGIPPLSGFWPKISLITAGFSTTENYLLIAFIIFGSFVTLLVIAKLWSEVFWKESEPISFKVNFKSFHSMKKKEQFSLVFAIANFGICIALHWFWCRTYSKFIQ
jgi:multicomponent Na+:H+ antiporter subunit D